jgi:hypothetical protein
VGRTFCWKRLETERTRNGIDAVRARLQALETEAAARTSGLIVSRARAARMGANDLGVLP